VKGNWSRPLNSKRASSRPRTRPHGDIIARLVADGSGPGLLRTHEAGTTAFVTSCRPENSERLRTEPGVISDARVRPDGRVWFFTSREDGSASFATTAARAAELGDEEPVEAGYETCTYKSTNPVHGFYVTPDDSGGPFPCSVSCTRPDLARQATAGSRRFRRSRRGIRSGMGQLRGSTGYGREWRDTLMGTSAARSSKDVNAPAGSGRARIADGERGDPATVGRHVTLLELGKHPTMCVAQSGVPWEIRGRYETFACSGLRSRLSEENRVTFLS